MYIQQPEGHTQLSVDCNVSDGKLFANVKANSGRGIPAIKIAKEHDGTALVVGGGPSIGGQLDTILKMQAEGAQVFALNNAAKYLAENGIRADYQIVLDARPQNAEFVRVDRADILLLASQCDPGLFDAAIDRGASILLWHPLIEGIDVYTHDTSPCLIGGGTTVGLSGLCLVYTMGYRNIHLFGYDSSHAENKSHAYEQDMNKNDQLLRVAVNDRVFSASITMVAQAEKFPALAGELMKLGCNLTLHGDGLLNAIMEHATREEKILTACYDLGSSPPTYDFMSFLAEAEKARKKGGFNRIDVIFQPGPIGGFRDDQLPPDVAERDGMLHRVCVSSCRLLPSVRNVEILKERREVVGDVFPEGWAINNPIPHYGTRYIKKADLCFRATESAKRQAKRITPERYATITLREAEYWPPRNSNITAWMVVANWLREQGITPLVIPDTNGKPLTGHQNVTEAAWDVDLRLALYEGAEVNLGVANGPFLLCAFANASYLMFKPVADAPASTLQFWAAHGMAMGDQFGTNGKIVWADDTAEVVIHAITQLLEEKNAR